jgi:UDP-GlcNAc:undecaprenyl-phosphate/decaprenyl-phosphate GlcNAc-1-phosphate transferase
MPEEIRLAISFGLAVTLAILATPVARRIATETSFYDHPKGYKKHARPTPYLGGTAVVLAVVISTVVALGGDISHVGVVLGSALALFAIGALDDRVGLGILPRFAIQVLAAFVLWAGDAGWQVFASESANLGFTLLWVVGLVNAFNLLDNLDGATGSVASVAAGGAGLLAFAKGDTAMAVLALALSGGCLGFLPYNLARPSRIFLGDAGSMPIGLIVAAVIMSIPHSDSGLATLFAAAPLGGIAIFDTTLVVFSRWRRGARVLSGARDHLTHRLFARLRTARRVALALAGVQVALCGLSALLYFMSPQAAIAAGFLYVTVGAAVLIRLEARLLTPGLARESF